MSAPLPPILLLAVAWLAGLALARLPDARAGVWLLVAALAGLVLGRRWLGRSWVIALAALVVALLGLARGWPAPPTVTASLPADTTGIRGIVVDWPRHGEREQHARVAVTAAARGGVWQPQAGTVAATVPLLPALAPGDEVEALGSLRPASASEAGLAGALRARRVTVLASTSPAGPSAWRPVVIHSLTAALERALPARVAGLVAGVVLGDRSGISPATRAAFAATGTTHLLVVSGWNVSLVVGLVTWLALRLRLGSAAVRLAFALVTVAGFTLLVGAEPAVVRAALMGGVTVTALAFGRRADPLTSLAVTAAFMAGLQPALLGDLGFGLSALATLGLVLIVPATQPRLARLPGPARWPAEALAATLAATIAVQPLLTAAFGQVSLISPLANLLAAPWVPLVMVGGVVVILVGLAANLVTGDPFVPVVSELAGWATTLVATPLLATVEIGAGLPLATVTLPPPPLAVTLVMYALLALLALPLLSPRPALAVRQAVLATRRSLPALAIVTVTLVACLVWLAVVW